MCSSGGRRLNRQGYFIAMENVSLSFIEHQIAAKVSCLRAAVAQGIEQLALNQRVSEPSYLLLHEK